MIIDFVYQFEIQYYYRVHNLRHYTNM